jgi:hypothetical protein
MTTQDPNPIIVRPLPTTAYRLAMHRETSINRPTINPEEAEVTRCGSEYHKFRPSEYEGDDCPFCGAPAGLRWCYRWCRERNIPVRFHERLDAMFIPQEKSSSVSFDLNCYGGRVCRISFLSAKNPRDISIHFKNKLISLGFFSKCAVIGEFCGFMTQGKMADMQDQLAKALCGEGMQPVKNMWIQKGIEMATELGF